jgi:hypothetical protein
MVTTSLSPIGGRNTMVELDVIESRGSIPLLLGKNWLHATGAIHIFEYDILLIRPSSPEAPWLQYVNESTGAIRPPPDAPTTPTELLRHLQRSDSFDRIRP